MRHLRALAVRVAGLVRRRRQEAELTEELETHVEMLTEDYVRSGMSLTEARRTARMKVGGVESVKESCRDAQRVPYLENALRDFRHALRAIRRTPAFSTVIVLSLGIALGANTAIVNLGHELFYRSLPIEEPERVVKLYSTHPELGDGSPLNFLNWRDIASESETLAEVGGYEWASAPVTLDGRTARFPAQIVSGNYFELLGISAFSGRTFSEAAKRIPGAELEAVVSHRFFQRQLGGDSSRIGKVLLIYGQPFRVVGVTPPEFMGLNVGLRMDIWIPFGTYRQIDPEANWVWYENRRGLLVYGIGRLAPGMSLEQMHSELATIAHTLESTYPEFNENRGILALPISQATIFPWARPFVRNGVWLLVGAVALTLLIAAVNVANLLLLRARERGREVSIQIALGISRSALAARVVMESVALSFLGGLAGLSFLWLAQTALERVVSVIPSPRVAPYQLDLDLEPALLVVAFGLALTLGLGLGLFPVLAALKGGSEEALRTRGEATAEARSQFGVRNGLLVLQLALSIVALFGGSLFFRSLHQIRGLDPGFERLRLAFVRVDLSSPGDPGRVAASARERIVDAMTQLPGVESVGVSPRRAMDGGWSRPMAPIELASDPDEHIAPYTDRVDGNFFETMGLALLEGRTFERREEVEPPRVAILNEHLAKRLWPESTAVGRSLVLFDLAGETPLEIIGVVEDSKYRRVTESQEGYVYMPLPRDYSGLLTFAIRTSDRPEGTLAAAQSEIRRLVPWAPIADARTVSEVLDRSMWGPRLATAFVGVFALVALLLSAVGIYGVISYDVSRRIREFCIRVSVGAERGDIAALVMRQSGKHYLLGIVLGLPFAYAAARWVSHMIFVDVFDPYAGAGAFLPLLIVGFLASLIPARRATALDPNEVLRRE